MYLCITHLSRPSLADGSTWLPCRRRRVYLRRRDVWVGGALFPFADPRPLTARCWRARREEPDSAQVKDLQNFMETEQQKAVIQAAISKLTEMCFDKCVQKPGTRLDPSEANCIANCAGRFLDSSVFVVNRMMAKRQQQQ